MDDVPPALRAFPAAGFRLGAAFPARLGGRRPGPDPTVLTAAQLPVESFLELDAFEPIKISPDGVHIAATVPMEGRMMLVFLRLSDMKQTGGLTLTEDAEVDDFVWVNPRQVVYLGAREERLAGAPARQSASCTWPTRTAARAAWSTRTARIS